MKRALYKKYNYILKYCVIFTFVFLGSFWWIVTGNKTFVSTWDGMPQHYVALAYIGEYIRKLWTSLWNGNFEFYTWDFSLGMGADIWQTFNYYGLGDPMIGFLSALVPTVYTEVLYGFLVYSKMFLAGLCFIQLCRELEIYNSSIWIGALMYPFCNFGVESAYGHYFFLNALIFLPLLIIGIERILTKNKPMTMIVTTLLGFAINYYFFYMCAIAVALYGIVRGWGFFSKNVKGYCFFLLRCIIASGAGILISLPVSLPAVLGLLNSYRKQGGSIMLKSLLLPDKILLAKQVLGVVSGPTNWNYLGVSVIIIPVVAMVFAEKGKNWFKYKIAILILGGAMCIPLTGLIMNGFSYVSYRYLFVLSFFSCLLVVYINPLEKNLKQVSLWFIALCLIFMILSIYIQYNIVNTLGMKLELACVFLIIITLMLNSKTKYKNYIVTSVVVTNIVLHVWTSLCPYFDSNQLYHMENRGEVYDNSVENGLLNFEALETDRGFYRVSAAADAIYTPNYGILKDQSTTSIYFSILNGFLIQSMVEWGNRGVYLLHSLGSLDSRIELESLAASKYYVTLEGRTIDVPYGYEEVEAQQEYVLYENNNALPLGVVYTDYVTAEYVSQYNEIEKSNMLLDGVLLENKISDWEPAEFMPTSYRVNSECQISNAVLTDGVLYADGPYELNISMDSIPNCQYYVRFVGMIGSNEDQIIGVTTPTGYKSYLLKGDVSRYYYQSEAVTYNLGYYKNGLSECTVSLQLADRAKLEDVEIWVVPMENYQEQIDKLKGTVLQEVYVQNDCVSGQVDLIERGILYLSIPYSEGWTAYDNGQKIEVYRANGGYVGLVLSEGNHNIILRYSSPGMKEGIVVSGSLLAVMVVFGIYKRICMRKKNGPKD